MRIVCDNKECKIGCYFDLPYGQGIKRVSCEEFWKIAEQHNIK